MAALQLAVLASGDRVLQRHNITSATAVCNDGSPAAYYFRAADDPSQSHIWVFQQQGGGWCWDAKTCLARAESSPSLVSSNSWPSTYNAVAGSILSATGTQFASANVVYLKYCTSDGYIGDVAASAATSNMHFRGRWVVSATIAALQDSAFLHFLNSSWACYTCSPLKSRTLVTSMYTVHRDDV